MCTLTELVMLITIMHTVVVSGGHQGLAPSGSAYLRMILLRSLATILLHSGQADVASATAADVSLAFMHGTVAMTSPVAGFLTYNVICHTIA